MLTPALISLLILNVVAAIIPRNGPCIPGELVWQDCNLCTCTQRGVANFICANMWCQPPPRSKGMTTENPFEGEDEEANETD